MAGKVKRSVSWTPGGETRNAAESAKDGDEYTRSRVDTSPANRALNRTRSQLTSCDVVHSRRLARALCCSV